MSVENWRYAKLKQPIHGHVRERARIYCGGDGMSLLLSLFIAAQAPVVEVTLGDVLLYDYPGVEWVLEEPGLPGRA